MGDRANNSCSPCVSTNFGNQIGRYRGSAKDHILLTKLNELTEKMQEPNIPEGMTLMYRNGQWVPMTPHLVPKFRNTSSDKNKLPLYFDVKTGSIGVQWT